MNKFLNTNGEGRVLLDVTLGYFVQEPTKAGKSRKSQHQNKARDYCLVKTPIDCEDF